MGPLIHFRLCYAKWCFATCGLVVQSNSQHMANPHIFYPAGPKHITKPFDAFQPPILLCDKLATFGISSDFSPVVKIHNAEFRTCSISANGKHGCDQSVQKWKDWMTEGQTKCQTLQSKCLSYFCLLLHKFHCCATSVLNSCSKTLVSFFFPPNYFVTCTDFLIF